jgi:hypothetical protein
VEKKKSLVLFLCFAFCALGAFFIGRAALFLFAFGAAFFASGAVAGTVVFSLGRASGESEAKNSEEHEGFIHAERMVRNGSFVNGRTYEQNKGAN